MDVMIPLCNGADDEKRSVHREGSTDSPVETIPYASQQGVMGVWRFAMKFLRFLGASLVFLGCLAALAGVLATAAPLIENDHVRLILASFSEKSLDPLINAVNRVMLYCLNHNYLLFGIGAGVMLLGGIVKTAAARVLYARGSASPAAAARIADATAVPRQAEKSPNRSPSTNPAAATPAAAAVGLSPYTAAAYGQALSQKDGAAATSDIAAKYKPRSIIDTDVMRANPSGSGSAPTATRGRDPICAACGAKNAPEMLFCDQCGSRLTELKQQASNPAMDVRQTQQAATLGGRLESLARDAVQATRKATAEGGRPMVTPVPAYVPDMATLRDREQRVTGNANPVTAQAAQPAEAYSTADLFGAGEPPAVREDYSATFVPPTVQLDTAVAERQPAAVWRPEPEVSTVAARTQAARAAVHAEPKQMAEPLADDWPQLMDENRYVPHHGGDHVAPELPQEPGAAEYSWSGSVRTAQHDETGNLQQPSAPYVSGSTQTHQAAAEKLPARPRIISTIGKKSTR